MDDQRAAAALSDALILIDAQLTATPPPTDAQRSELETTQNQLAILFLKAQKRELGEAADAVAKAAARLKEVIQNNSREPSDAFLRQLRTSSTQVGDLVRQVVGGSPVGDTTSAAPPGGLGNVAGGGQATPRPSGSVAIPPGATPAPAGAPSGGRVVMALAPSLTRHVQGPGVIALQLALIKAGQAIEPDGDFGGVTARALGRWQAANGFAERDFIDAPQWERLTGRALPSLFDLALDVTSAFEGTGFDLVTGNFDGAGITFGLIGFTLANGELRQLLTAIEAARPGAVASAFGALYPALMAATDAPRAARVAWADTISTGRTKSSVLAPWRDAFAQLGALPAARRAQIERARDKYWTAAAALIRDFMLAFGKPVTALDAAFWFDVAVQNSLGDSEREALQGEAKKPATGTALRRQFAQVISDASSPDWRNDVLARKMTFVDGSGTVHGALYQLDRWGLTETPVTNADLAAGSTVIDVVSMGLDGPTVSRLAPDEEAGEATRVDAPASNPNPTADNNPNLAWPPYQRFVAKVRGWGLKYFSADELLFLGGQNAGGSCGGLNTYPPEELWDNIAPTAAVLDRLRGEVGTPIRVLSLYRSPAYNSCIQGSAANSMHMRYKAIDFVCETGHPADWAAKLRDYRSRGIFQGGIGVYQSFVHVDTRGVNADWTG